MRILITGNMGYVGSVLSERLRRTRPGAEIVGYDAAFFAPLILPGNPLPERHLDRQIFGDVRGPIPRDLFDGVDAVIHLAAISNDPMGKAYEALTDAVNHRATTELARAAKAAGVGSFVLASSCSVYGAGGDERRNEDSPVDPLTAYARSKVDAERALAPLAGAGFRVSLLRFATACGASPRLRLDLVLNDFVACALASREITILSDGTPWRPLIDVSDMASALDWAVDRSAGGDLALLNVGSNAWNFQVRDLARAVSDAVAGTRISVNAAAAPDKRSYAVDFSRFRSLAPSRYHPAATLASSIGALRDSLEGFSDTRFREGPLMRLRALERLRDAGRLDQDLRWTRARAEAIAA